MGLEWESLDVIERNLYVESGPISIPHLPLAYGDSKPNAEVIGDLAGMVFCSSLVIGQSWSLASQNRRAEGRSLMWHPSPLACR